MKKLSFVLFALLIAPCAAGQIKMAAMFSDNMVLQRNSEAKIWGWAAGRGETLRVVGSWNTADTVNAVVDNHARWEATLKTGDAGGPYAITILGCGGHTIANVLLGEVWLCSGQSNMEWSYNHGLSNGDVEIPAADHPDIRIFTTMMIASATPQDDCRGEWEVCTPEVMRRSSAVAYFFARSLKRKLGVPVGVIVSAWGGTCAEVWTPAEMVNGDSQLAAAAAFQEDLPWWPFKPGVAYNAMIYPFAGYRIVGSIWYQGEGNSTKSTYATYDKLMRTLIGCWRNDFGAGMPFYYVQIAPFNYGENNVAQLLREQQTRTLGLRGTGMAVVSDLVDNVGNIHPGNKYDVGDRLADLALADIYCKPDWPHLYPQYDKMTVEKNRAVVTFRDAPGGITVRGDKVLAVRIAGADRRFVEANAQVKDGKLIVWSKEVKEPVAVRFSFTNNSIGNLFSGEGLPAVPFRTDDWDEIY